jgi:acetate kinase
VKILILNAGSSSQKSRLYEVGESLPNDPPAPLWQADADWGSHPGSTSLKIRNASGAKHEATLSTDARTEVIDHMLAALWSGPTKVIESASAIDVVGHRVVHGGDEFEESVVISPQVKDAIRRMIPLAPEHNPANLEGIEVVEKLLPSVPQVAAFDTAFHRTMPPSAAVYPIPYALYEQDHIHRYGFHGISHQYLARQAPRMLKRDPNTLRLITCHLGNGCSLAAIQGGRSIDTTMGFTPLEGLMMGSRSGSVDPGILLYLLREKRYIGEQLDTMLNKQSGLRGIAGSGDMRSVLQGMRDKNARATLAFDMYIHRLRAGIGAMLATLGGLDALVFSGGVGENSDEARAAACGAFAFLGLRLDEQKNAQSGDEDRDIATSDSAVRVLVIHTQEDWAIARDCWRLMR